MKNMNINFFDNDKYKEKIYSVTNLRLLSFEIYKLITLYIFMKILCLLCNFFPFSFFYQIEFNTYTLLKIFIFLLVLDICYFILFKTNEGQFSLIEILISLILKRNIIKTFLISISFCFIFLSIIELKSLMPRLNSEYIKKIYKIEPTYKDEYEENYYERKGITKSTIYESSDFIFTLILSFILSNNFIFIKQEYNLWPKLNLGRYDNFKNKILISIKNIGLIGVPGFIFLYIFFIYYYHTLLIVNLTFNYLSLSILQYSILYITIDCMNNFICAKINYNCKEIYSIDKLIREEINFKNEENFYIIHHLKNLSDLYKYIYDIKINTNLLNFENLKIIKNKIYFFIDSLNRKYSIFLSKRKFFNINRNSNAIDKIKINLNYIIDYFDFSANQVIENDTCIENIKQIIEILGNLIIFIAEAKIDKSNEEKYMIYSDYIYFFIERIFDIDGILLNLIKNRKTSEQLRNDLIKLRIFINNYFGLIRNRQHRYKFIRLETEKIKYILYPNNNN